MCFNDKARKEIIILLNVIITILLLIGLSINWYKWDYRFNDSTTSGNWVSKGACTISHTIGWYSENCYVSKKCSRDRYTVDYCNFDSSWRDQASDERKAVYNVSFGCCLIALFSNVIGLVNAIIILRRRNKKNNGFKILSLFGCLPFVFSLAGFAYFYHKLPSSYQSESQNGKCVIPNFPQNVSFYDHTNMTSSPCSSFSGSFDVDLWNGPATFKWGGSGLYALIPVIILSSIMTGLYLYIAFCSCNNNTEEESDQASLTTPNTVTVIHPNNNNNAYNNYSNDKMNSRDNGNPSFEHLKAILIELGLGKYVENFRDHNFDYGLFLKFPVLSTLEQEQIVPDIESRLRIESYIQQQQQFNNNNNINNNYNPQQIISNTSYNPTAPPNISQILDDPPPYSNN